MGPADSHRITPVPRYSGYRQVPSAFGYRIVTFCDETFQTLLLCIQVPQRGPTTPTLHCYSGGLGSSPFARHYWGNHCYFLFLEVLRCFSSLRSPPYINIRITALQAAGLSHSEIAGSRVIYTYPALIAAYHVLHRLREPRHPPSALSYFLIAIVHTFSCHATPYIPSKGKQEGTAKSYCLILFVSVTESFIFLTFYSLACVNMSKSSSNGQLRIDN